MAASCFVTSTVFFPSQINNNRYTSTTHSTRVFCKITKTKAKQHCDDSKVVVRRSADYQPSVWDDNYLQSLNNDFMGEAHKRRVENLKGKARILLNNAGGPSHQLELIDTLQRLGLGYNFKLEIETILHNIYSKTKTNHLGNLYVTAIQFRLLREHGYHVPQEVFENFKDETGDFKECVGGDDVRGILSLYEASYYSVEGESIMEEAWDFATRHLKKLDDERVLDGRDPILAMQVRHALELPLHWRRTRFEARWFIDLYEKTNDMNPMLLELAKLDFNILQGMYKEELKDLSRWWKNCGLVEKLSFARDRLVASHLWAIGIADEPQFANCRKVITKVIALITVIDDVYDVYGTLDELKLFTDVVERWDINAIKQLPDYLKICFFALFNTVNEMAFDILKEHGLDVLPNLKKAWIDLMNAYLVEAEWFHGGYKPTLEEYMNNGVFSITGPSITSHGYLFSAKPIRETDLNFLENDPDFVRHFSCIFRLQDDLGTSSDELQRGDVPKSIQCYMNETGACEEDARKYIKELMRKTWKKTNAVDCVLPQSAIVVMSNLARTSHCMYRYGDGHGVEDHVSKTRACSMLFEPIH
ncbi:terpene synthase 10-like isoform X2 [Tripterygium wilfordii]|uniref:terpene synthase 10-like isoform X1 n=1 Tax=Tripterygium wilfordii TaxID=458696 RepID=UPI0018F7F670|nr:terpene synthase 10-like isoform X1 [Tripterygium wilfordii]XP_038679211.1 terpene synthase 10-like isoform X2 [Tripterygium wilfordii]